MTEGEGNKGKSEIQKSEYLKNEKNLLDEAKSVFHKSVSVSLCKCYHLLNKRKMADTSFKLS